MNERPPLDDHEIDRRARQYALAHRVDYADAVKAVVEFSAPPDNAAPSRAPVSDNAAKAAEAALDAKARQYALEHGVRYADALQHVLTAPALPRQGSESLDTAGGDVAIDRRASAYARRFGVSYSEALDHVCHSDSAGSPGLVACFSEMDGSMAIPTLKQMMEGQWIEIFKSGKHVSSDGESIDFTVEDVKAIADGYQPHIREAPLVEGHPVLDAPAQGWVDALKATPDGKLLMRARQVNPEFAERVKAGRFKKRSAAFYRPGERSNPSGGAWYLRHVGFLGAHQPAIAGLRDIVFGPVH